MGGDLKTTGGLQSSGDEYEKRDELCWSFKDVDVKLNSCRRFCSMMYLVSLGAFSLGTS